MNFPSPLARLRLAAVLTASLAPIAPTIAQATIRVPSQQPTIQAGIDAAAPGDIVLIEPGLYPVTGLSTNGKQLTLRGEQGALQTVLDGGHAGRILTIDTFEGPNLVLEGLTFFRGNSSGGGAMLIGTNAAPTIRDCIFDNNRGGSGSSLRIGADATPTILRTQFIGNGDPAQANSSMPTVVVSTSTPFTMTECTFRNNLGTASDLLLLGPAAVIDRCLFENSHGVAIGNASGALTVRRTTFRGTPSIRPRLIMEASNNTSPSVRIEDCVFENLATERGVLSTAAPTTVLRTRFTSNSCTSNTLLAGIGSGDLVFDECTFEDNSALGFSTGMLLLGFFHTSTLRRCRFTGSVSNRSVVRASGATTIESCLFYDNTTSTGGALSLENQCTVDHCTFVDNLSTGAGAAGGINAQAPSTIRSSILWNNAPQQILVPQGATPPTVSYCNVLGGFAGTGNLGSDPGFVSTTPFDHRLSLNSPCRDAALPGTPAVLLDLDGDPRLLGTAPDIGADEILDQPYPGTNEDLEITTVLNGAGDPLASQKQPAPGDLLRMELDSRDGTFVGAPFLVLGQFHPTGLPIGPGLLPGLDLDPTSAGFFVLFASTQVLPQLGGLLLPAEGFTLEVNVPAGGAGFSMHMQGAALSPAAANGGYAVSNAHEIMLP